MSDVLPINPKQAKARRITATPSAVIESFNELIVENFDRGCATVSQKKVLTRIQSKMDALGDVYTAQQICDKGWLNVEDVYRASGWRVLYDKPGFNETYDATFEFTAKKSSGD